MRVLPCLQRLHIRNISLSILSSNPSISNKNQYIKYLHTRKPGLYLSRPRLSLRHPFLHTLHLFLTLCLFLVHLLSRLSRLFCLPSPSKISPVPPMQENPDKKPYGPSGHVDHKTLLMHLESSYLPPLAHRLMSSIRRWISKLLLSLRLWSPRFPLLLTTKVVVLHPHRHHNLQQQRQPPLH